MLLAPWLALRVQPPLLEVVLVLALVLVLVLALALALALALVLVLVLRITRCAQAVARSSTLPRGNRSSV